MRHLGPGKHLPTPRQLKSEEIAFVGCCEKTISFLASGNFILRYLEAPPDYPHTKAPHLSKSCTVTYFRTESSYPPRASSHYFCPAKFLSKSITPAALQSWRSTGLRGSMTSASIPAGGQTSRNTSHQENLPSSPHKEVQSRAKSLFAHLPLDSHQPSNRNHALGHE